MKYFDKRQNSLNVPEEQLDKLFKEIVDTFGKEWLEDSKGTHPIQILWNRRDALSTNELFLVAHSISRLNQVDKQWVAHQIRQLLSEDINNRKGAFFELIGLNMLIPLSGKLIPSNVNQPAIDAIIHCNGKGEINLSLKNYGLSYHHDTFLVKSEEVKNKTIEILKTLGYSKIQIFIETLKYPDAKDWELLSSNLYNILKNYKGSFINVRVDGWNIGMNELMASGELYHDSFISYTFLLSSVYHKNEHLNLTSKLDEAGSNLKAQLGNNNNDIPNIIFFHLPITASMQKCIDWALDYLHEYPDEPIYGALFYQPAIVHDLEKRHNVIAHYVVPVFGEKYTQWRSLHSGYVMSFQGPVGIYINKPSELIITDGKGLKINIDERYIYQRGEHYIAAKQTNQGFGGNITSLGPGIRQKLVIQIAPLAPPLVLEGRFGDELLVI